MPALHSALPRTSARSTSITEPACAEIGLGVRCHLAFGEHRSRVGAPRGIADTGGEVADDQDRDVAGILELPELAQHDRVTEREIGPARVDPELHAERPAERQLLLETALRYDVDGAAAQNLQIVCLVARHPRGCYQWRCRRPPRLPPHPRFTLARRCATADASPCSASMLLLAVVDDGLRLAEHRRVRPAAPRADLVPVRRRRLVDHRAPRGREPGRPARACRWPPLSATPRSRSRTAASSPTTGSTCGRSPERRSSTRTRVRSPRAAPRSPSSS